MEIFIGADYKGFDKKMLLLPFLIKLKLNVVDEGAHTKIEGDDFNDPAINVAKKVRENPGAFGILICDSAHGVTMQANRFKGIRAAHCNTVESARLAREHDNANVLCMSAHFLNERKMKKIIKEFLRTEFKPLKRRVRRVKRLDERSDYD